MPTYTPLQSIELTAATSSIIFSGIPQIYQDLVLVANIAASSTTYISGRVNGDSGQNYSYTYLLGSGSAATSGRGSNTTSIGSARTDSNSVSTFHFINYSNTTTNKTVLYRISNGGVGTSAWVNLWRNTAAITSIELFSDSANSWNAGSTFDLYGISPVQAGVAKAFGGTDVVYDSTYVYHVFKGSGTFTPYSNVTADVLVVAGGGAGGADASGGGGAGGLLGFTSQSLTSGTNYTVTVGAGGARTTSGNGNVGSDSQFGSLTLVKGGGGGGTYGNNGQSGGSGGGAGGISGGGTLSGGTATPSGQGNNGGGRSGGTSYGQGGGGGAGAVGGASTGGNGGNGGDGSSAYSSWGLATNTGELVSGTYYYAGGGGGGTQGGQTVGTGGYGGGSAGTNTGTPNNATANTGGGGGGTTFAGTQNSGAGGSGIVIVRYAR